MKSISVFCGSSGGNRDIFEKTAGQLGEILALQQISVIYGGK